jgi:hypothetical protein
MFIATIVGNMINQEMLGCFTNLSGTQRRTLPRPTSRGNASGGAPKKACRTKRAQTKGSEPHGTGDEEPTLEKIHVGLSENGVYLYTSKMTIKNNFTRENTAK